MDDISGKIKEILNDPESMQQIKELADMLTGGAPPDDPAGGAECFDPEYEKPSESGGTPPDFGGLLSMLTGGGSAGIDPGMIMRITQIIGSVSANDTNRAFLTALRPLLSEDKQRKIDKAIKLLLETVRAPRS